MASWTASDSNELYNIQGWSRGYFSAAPTGQLMAHPAGPEGGAIDLSALVAELEERGIQAPILLRFTDLLGERVQTIAGAFAQSIADYGYQGRYRGVYPIKVNQQAQLVEDLVEVLRPHHMGLEAGSKPELLVTLALLDDPKALIICNGYKDEEYIETAMLAQKLGRNPILVIEKLSEVDLIIEVATRTGLRPRLGLRSKLSAIGKGHWADSSGDKAKFGLTAMDMVELVRRLKEAGYLDCLQLLHFHIGSQISAIRSFKDAVKEAGRTYTELVRLGAPMGIFDVGGGLGVDYDGSQTNFRSSMNYSEQEYANDIVSGVQAACDKAKVPHPDIVTETGRALVAHHAALVFNVLGVAQLPTESKPVTLPEDSPQQITDMAEILGQVNARNVRESWHDALAIRTEARSAYTLGLLNLEQRALLEQLFWQICGKVRAIIRDFDFIPDELQKLERSLADTYYCNFSVFQSVPDSWAIGQLFPVVPIHRLNEEPTRRAVLADITCDSDGKLDRFIDRRELKNVLELHPLRPQEEYYLGIFLVGAYQEILGDLHNLFGDTNAVHVRLEEDGGFEIEHVYEGDTVTEVLGYVEYSRDALIKRVRNASERALKQGNITLKESRSLMRHYRSGLEGYTYLERDVS